MKSVVVITGRCSRDPELRYVGEKNTAVCDVGIACDSGFGDNKTSCFVDLTLWGRQAEVCHEYLKKGNVFQVDGELVQESWEDKQSGQKRSKLKVKVKDLTLFPKSMNGNPREQLVGAGASNGSGSPDLPF